MTVLEGRAPGERGSGVVPSAKGPVKGLHRVVRRDGRRKEVQPLRSGCREHGTLRAVITETALQIGHVHRARLKGHHADVGEALSDNGCVAAHLGFVATVGPATRAEPISVLANEPESLRMVQHRDMPAHVRAHVYIHVLSTGAQRWPEQRLHRREARPQLCKAGRRSARPKRRHLSRAPGGAGRLGPALGQRVAIRDFHSEIVSCETF